jgi:hypothetical protein
MEGKSRHTKPTSTRDCIVSVSLKSKGCAQMASSTGGGREEAFNLVITCRQIQLVVETSLHTLSAYYDALGNASGKATLMNLCRKQQDRFISVITRW